jgi:hypothetical protein
MSIVESARNLRYNPRLDPLEIGSDYDTSRWTEKDVKQRLSIYGSASLMVNDVNVYDKGRRGIARFVATGEPVRPILSGNLEARHGKGRYKITETDAKEHFVESTGLVINPGIRNIAIARLTGDDYVNGQNPKRGLARISSVVLKSPVAPGAVVDADIFISQGGRSDGELSFEGNVKSGDKTIVDLKLSYREDVPVHIPGATVDPEYFIESAAQTALLLMQKSKELDGMDNIFPLFGGFDSADIKDTVRVGEAVTIDISMGAGTKGFSGNARILKADGSTAQIIKGLNGVVKEKTERTIGVINRILIK